MNRRIFFGLALAAPAALKAQTTEIDLGNLLDAGQQWLKDNIDESILKSLPQLDQERFQRFFEDLRTRFQGQYVIDLAAMRQVAKQMVPILESFDNTYPYGAWLRAHLSDFDVADELRITIKPTAPPLRIIPSTPPPALTAPTNRPPSQPVLPPPNVLTNRPPTPPVVRLGPTTPPPATVPQPTTQPIVRPRPTADQIREAWQKEVLVMEKPKASVPLVPRLKRIFSGQGAPPELVWLGEVESGFNPRARSPVGAVGMFQLMPETARSLGLALRPHDQRMDERPSAKAAATYLRNLALRFHDWRLAVAAYNAGESRVHDLLVRRRARHYDTIADDLPAETQLYVPKVEAVVKRREGVWLEDLPIA